MSNDKQKVIVSIHYDEARENPCTESGDQWMVNPFSNRFSNHKDPSEFGIFRDNKTGKLGTEDEDFAKKLKEGLAFFLGYFEHGNCLWFLSGERPFGTEGDFRWDGVDVAGVIIWNHPPDRIGAKTYEDREQDARSFLESYTSWANGECYGFDVRVHEICDACSQEKNDSETIDGCYGFYGMDFMLKEIKAVTEGYEVIRVEGTASHGVEINQVQGEKEEATANG